MSKIIFNLFEPSSIASSISTLFQLEEIEVKEYLDNIDFNGSYLDNECIKFISRFDLETKNINYDNAYLKVKHTTTTVDNLDSIREHGLKELGYVLTENTPIKRFLDDYKIKVDVANKKIIVNDLSYDIFGFEEEYKNATTQYNINIHNIYKKLYIDKGEIEAFSKIDIDGIKEYSTIENYPEIFDNLDTFLRHINKSVYLGNSWLNTYNSECYILEFEIPITCIDNNGKSLIYKLLKDCFESLLGKKIIGVAINFDTEIPFETINAILLPS